MCLDSEVRKLSANNRRRKDYYKLPLSNRQLLDEISWRARLEAVDEKIMANAEFLAMVVDHPDIFAMEGQTGGPEESQGI